MFLTVQNLVIQYVPYVDSNAQQQSGAPIPEAALGGTGHAWVLTGGAASRATWTRFGLDAPTYYTGPDNENIRFAESWSCRAPISAPSYGPRM